MYSIRSIRSIKNVAEVRACRHGLVPMGGMTYVSGAQALLDPVRDCGFSVAGFDCQRVYYAIPADSILTKQTAVAQVAGPLATFLELLQCVDMTAEDKPYMKKKRATPMFLKAGSHYVNRC